ncbi:MlaC/ttg2D family ABC transporter substrate-binding protein [Kangiella sediminilitoris]|uniref:Toluene tolerance family protein n=1 Tax=Kangiella sediminilitoris TaxID=1144748 RepID=A0A1B3B9Y2_9GAMM|nr:ABC transporter substrate-binding protein [Kangiella sediminilitoris]AOE49622.1 Toluene tolerance family protein [Kangiella sediminilitoris]
MKNIMPKALITLTLLVLSFKSMAFADPKLHLEEVTKKISQEIMQNKEKIKTDAEYAKGLIKTYLLPEVDSEYMAKRILGKTYWMEATEEQRKKFIDEFIGLLLNSYAKGLANYDGQPITYDDTQYSRSGNLANVRSTIIPNEGEPILIDYRLKVQPDESWLVTDVIIEGVSMAKSYATQYREQIAKIGLEETLKRLEAENERAKNATEISDLKEQQT